MIEVSAGILQRADGRILVCRRGPGRRNAHLWEFPGGKREPGEDAAACLARELEEELSLQVSGLRTVRTAEEGGIRFTFLTGCCRSEPVPTEHEAICFARPRELLSLPFCPADAPVARTLALGHPPLTALVWDFDGTLYDTYPVLSRTLADATRELGIPTDPDEALTLMKQSLHHALVTLAARGQTDPDLLRQAYRRHEALTPPAAFPPLPGIPEALRELRRRGCRHLMLTHRGHSALEALEAHGLLPLFTGWVTAEDGLPRKPDPASLRVLMARHGLAPEEVCMIGDRSLDLEAGQAAGTLSCLLDPDRWLDPSPVPLTARHAGELPELLRPEVIQLPVQI